MAGTPKPEKGYRRNRLGGLTRQHGPDDPRVHEAKRDLEVTNLADHVSAVIAAWPDVPEEQLDHIAGLLRAGRDAP